MNTQKTLIDVAKEVLSCTALKNSCSQCLGKLEEAIDGAEAQPSREQLIEMLEALITHETAALNGTRAGNYRSLDAALGICNRDFQKAKQMKNQARALLSQVQK
jgi:CHASE3 domain sensor protein